ncbi:MAG: hypothetical protein KGN37_14800, partial [Burkholderiales bacterium]|nr:hypothetical protein [Burkholderiales bacterium]
LDANTAQDQWATFDQGVDIPTFTDSNLHMRHRLPEKGRIIPPCLWCTKVVRLQAHIANRHHIGSSCCLEWPTEG